MQSLNILQNELAKSQNNYKMYDEKTTKKRHIRNNSGTNSGSLNFEGGERETPDKIFNESRLKISYINIVPINK